VPDDDAIVADQDLLDQQSNHALRLDYVEGFGRRAQTGEKRSGNQFPEPRRSPAALTGDHAIAECRDDA
jgi:hypothetical protein